MRLFGKRRAVEPEAVFLSGFESEDHYLTRSVDWESEATDVDSALVMARDWIVTGDRQVEIIKARGGTGRVVAVVSAGGIEWITAELSRGSAARSVEHDR